MGTQLHRMTNRRAPWASSQRVRCSPWVEMLVARGAVSHLCSLLCRLAVMLCSLCSALVVPLLSLRVHQGAAERRQCVVRRGGGGHLGLGDVGQPHHPGPAEQSEQVGPAAAGAGSGRGHLAGGAHRSRADEPRESHSGHQAGPPPHPALRRSAGSTHTARTAHNSLLRGRGGGSGAAERAAPEQRIPRRLQGVWCSSHCASLLCFIVRLPCLRAMLM